MNCPVCDWASADVRPTVRRVQYVSCRRCGNFEITFEAAQLCPHIETVWRLRIAAWVRHTSRNSDKELLVGERDLRRIQENWRPRPVSEKLDALLVALAESSKYPGAATIVNPQCDLVLGWCDDVDELTFLLDALNARDLAHSTRGMDEWKVTARGWERVDALRSNLPPDSNLVFVAMSFAPELDGAWIQGYKAGLEDAGYRPERVDSTEHNGKIDDRILAKIREARFVIVDVTTQNRGAYFEAGFALGLGREVIWSVRQDDLEKVHFDTRQFNHIVWTDPVDLRTRLSNRVLAVFGRGALRNS